MSRGHTLSVLETAGRGHATALATGAVRDGADAVAVLGGDGTLNEVANALVDTDRVLVALPGGGTNVFCRTHGLGDDPGVAAADAAAALRRGDVQRIGVGEVRSPGADPRYFVINTGYRLGRGARLGGRASCSAQATSRPRPVRLCRPAHLLRRLRPPTAITSGSSSTTPSSVDDGYFALVLNSDPYTFVGPRPFSIDPANTAHVPFTVVVLRSMSAPHFLTVMSEALRGGGISPRPWLEVRSDVRSVAIRRSTTAPVPDRRRPPG